MIYDFAVVDRWIRIRGGLGIGTSRPRVNVVYILAAVNFGPTAVTWTQRRATGSELQDCGPAEYYPTKET